MDLSNLFARTSLYRACRDFPLVALDVGSRNGFDRALEPVAFAVDVVGFEPDPVECARLQRAADGAKGLWRSQRHICAALSGSGGPRKLGIPISPESASLLEHDPKVGQAFGMSAMFDVARVIDVDTMTMDEALASHAVAPPHYIKMDIEGAELEVFASARVGLERALAIKTEVSFIPMRRNQPLATDVDLVLRERGFVLVDLQAPIHWRRHSYVSHPQLARDKIPYSRGQLAQGDYLYFRHPDRIESTDVASSVRAAVLAMAFGHFDYAHALLTRPTVATHFRQAYDSDVTACVQEVSLAFGRRVWMGEFATHLRRIVTFLRSARVAGSG